MMFTEFTYVPTVRPRNGKGFCPGCKVFRDGQFYFWRELIIHIPDHDECMQLARAFTQELQSIEKNSMTVLITGLNRDVDSGE